MTEQKPDWHQTCPHCHGSLIEIDHYGERLVGCIECNRWSWRGGEQLFMELPEEDLISLREWTASRKTTAR